MSTSCKRDWVVYKMLDLHTVRQQRRWPSNLQVEMERKYILISLLHVKSQWVKR